MNSYILTHSLCSSCVWGENGYYNAICAHCPYCQYGKKEEPSWMSRETAEVLGLVKRSELITGKENSVIFVEGKLPIIQKLVTLNLRKGYILGTNHGGQD